MTIKQKYKIFKTQYETARSLMSEQSRAVFKEMAEDLFLQFPKMKSFGWTQFTDYFNDGEPCNFYVRGDAECIYINDEKEYYTQDLDENSEYDKKAAEEVAKMIQLFNDEMLLDLYGDHVKVTINRNGSADIDSHDHD